MKHEDTGPEREVIETLAGERPDLLRREGDRYIAGDIQPISSVASHEARLDQLLADAGAERVWRTDIPDTKRRQAGH